MRINVVGLALLLALSAPVAGAHAVEALDVHLDASRVGSHIQLKLIATNTGSMPLCFFPTTEDLYLTAEGKVVLRDIHPTIWIGPAWRFPNDGQTHAYAERVAEFHSIEEAARVATVRAQIELVYCSMTSWDKPLFYEVTGAVRGPETSSGAAR